MEIFRDQSKSFEERAADLVSRMTQEEKVSQIEHVAPAIPRLGVPYYNYWSEASHGLTGVNKTHVMDVTSFPSCIAMSHTWNRELIRDVSSIISDEARAYYNLEGDELHFWCPTINLARDPRWGRNEESFGEDPYLAGKLAAEYIKGMQGDDGKYLKTVSTPKHFALNNSECNRYSGSSDADESTIREYYAKVFEYAVKEGKPASVMTSYNRVNGIPASANTMLLKTLLREEFGFDGFVVSDCGAVSFIFTSAAFHKRGGEPKGHFYAKSVEEACATALKAGTDMSCGNEHEVGLLSAIQKGIVSEEDIDRALIRIFTSRFRLGLFDEPEKVKYHTLGKADICSEKAARLAEKAAEESIVLLKNEGNLLPLDTRKFRKILVIGPNAIYRQLGGYSCGNFTGMVDTRININPLDGIRKLAKEKNVEVAYTKGWDLIHRENPFAVWTLPGMEIPGERMIQAHIQAIKASQKYPPRYDPVDEEMNLKDKELLEKAKQMAAQADAVVVIAGTDRAIAREEHDRKDIRLPYGQDQKIREIAEINKNTIVFCISMGPVTGEFIDKVPVLAAAYYGGQAQGAAIAGVLFGTCCPSGRITQIWYQSEDDLPPITQYGIRPTDTDTGKGRTYQYFTGKVRYPFGYGLSFTTFEYRDFKLNREEYDANDTAEISVKIRNTGKYAGAEVVQLYVSKETVEGGFDNKPLRQLKGFEKVFLAPGEEKEVQLKLELPEVRFWDNMRRKYTVGAGTYILSLGRSSAKEDTVASCRIRVAGSLKPVLENFRLEIHKHILRAGESTMLLASATMTDAVHLCIDEYKPSYTSSDNSVAAVDPSGKVTAVSPGTVIITGTLSVDGVTKTSGVPVAVV